MVRLVATIFSAGNNSMEHKQRVPPDRPTAKLRKTKEAPDSDANDCATVVPPTGLTMPEESAPASATATGRPFQLARLLLGPCTDDPGFSWSAFVAQTTAGLTAPFLMSTHADRTGEGNGDHLALFAAFFFTGLVLSNRIACDHPCRKRYLGHGGHAGRPYTEDDGADDDGGDGVRVGAAGQRN